MTEFFFLVELNEEEEGEADEDEDDEDDDDDASVSTARPRRLSEIHMDTKVKPIPAYTSFFIFSHTNK